MNKIYRDKIVKSFQDNPVIREFNFLNNNLKNRRYLSQLNPDIKLKVCSPTDDQPFYFTEADMLRQSEMYKSSNLCRVASQIVVSGKNWVLMMALNTIIKRKLQFIPLCYEYDGFLVLANINESEETLELLNKYLQESLSKAHMCEILFEQK